MRYDPYPLAVLRPALDADLYDRLVNTFPAKELFGTLPKFPYKLSMSERYATENYDRFLAGNAEWNKFHAWVKSDSFIRQTLEFLRGQNIDLQVDDALDGFGPRAKRAVRNLIAGRLPSPGTRLRSRFEFSVLKADGGTVEPHTDSASKIITLVVSMIKPGEWDPALGGGLDVNRPTDDAYAFNWNNRQVPWDKIDVVENIPFVQNQCILFIKTHNSLHSVRRMNNSGSDALRKTVTIVIERD
jgi:hypothetical protein